MWKNETIVVRSRTASWQTIDDLVIILSPEQSKAYELNETASWIWKNLEANKNVEKLLQDFCLEYEVDLKTAEEDLKDIFTRMYQGQLITWN